ncbi:MAG: PstS family phosphate ABC transporter substrate-binding protein [Spirochaetia bacterium]|nr:PstS family phosphate ABC transporter substrate-binding protein [Spirochaetia bacterium]
MFQKISEVIKNIEKKFASIQRGHPFALKGSFFLIASLLFLAAGCKAKTKILVDGSSTVYPITEAVAEEYRNVDKTVNVTVGISGTGGGFKKFCNNEIHITDASRPIKSKEIKSCADNKIGYIEIPIAYDGLAVVVSSSNAFLNEITVDQLNHIFRYENPAKTWKEINPEWPDQEIKIYSPGQDSGTYDYFVETIIGKKGRVRADAAFSEDDNVLVTGINGSEFSIGYFGLAYYSENKDSLKLIPVINPKTKKAVKPDEQTVSSGQYAPLSRPIFIYVNAEASDKPEVKKFVEFYLGSLASLTSQTGYIPFRTGFYEVLNRRFADKITGTVFDAGHEGKTLDQLYR